MTSVSSVDPITKSKLFSPKKQILILVLIVLVDNNQAGARLPVPAPGKVIGPIEMPVNTRHIIETRPAAGRGHVRAPTVIVDANPVPLQVLLRSESSDLVVKNEHHSKPGKHRATYVVDDPHVVHHKIIRPIEHKVTEVIIPIRNVVQQFKPIEENIKSIFPEVKRKAAVKPPPIPLDVEDIEPEAEPESEPEPVTTVNNFEDY